MSGEFGTVDQKTIDPVSTPTTDTSVTPGNMENSGSSYGGDTPVQLPMLDTVSAQTNLSPFHAHIAYITNKSFPGLVKQETMDKIGDTFNLGGQGIYVSKVNSPQGENSSVETTAGGTTQSAPKAPSVVRGSLGTPEEEEKRSIKRELQGLTEEAVNSRAQLETAYQKINQLQEAAKPKPFITDKGNSWEVNFSPNASDAIAGIAGGLTTAGATAAAAPAGPLAIPPAIILGGAATYGTKQYFSTPFDIPKPSVKPLDLTGNTAEEIAADYIRKYGTTD